MVKELTSVTVMRSTGFWSVVLAADLADIRKERIFKVLKERWKCEGVVRHVTTPIYAKTSFISLDGNALFTRTKL